MQRGIFSDLDFSFVVAICTYIFLLLPAVVLALVLCVSQRGSIYQIKKVD